MTSDQNGHVVFRAGRHMLVVVGVFATFLIVLSLLVAVTRGQWTPFCVTAGLTLLLYVLLRHLCLEFWEEGFFLHQTGMLVTYGEFITIYGHGQ